MGICDVDHVFKVDLAPMVVSILSILPELTRPPWLLMATTDGRSFRPGVYRFYDFAPPCLPS